MCKKTFSRYIVSIYISSFNSIKLREWGNNSNEIQDVTQLYFHKYGIFDIVTDQNERHSSNSHVNYTICIKKLSIQD